MSGKLPIGPFDASTRQPLLLQCDIEGLRVTSARLVELAGPTGYEIGFEGLSPREGAVLASYVCARSAVHHASAFCDAVEDALGFEVPEGPAAARVVLSEWGRIASHLEVASDIGRALEDDLVYGRPRRYVRAIRDAFENACGNPFGFGAVVPGGVDLKGGPAALAGIKDIAAPLRRDARFWRRKLYLSRPRLTVAALRAPAGHGPATAFRAAGSEMDLRAGDLASGHYRELGYEPPRRKGGTAFERAEVLLAEITASLDLIEKSLPAAGEGPGAPAGIDYGKGSGVGAWESPHGGLEYRVFLGSEGRLIRVRTASAARQVADIAGTGLANILYEDAAAQFVTFNLCASCASSSSGGESAYTWQQAEG